MIVRGWRGEGRDGEGSKCGEKAKEDEWCGGEVLEQEEE